MRPRGYTLAALRCSSAALALLVGQAFLPSCLATYDVGTAVRLTVRAELEGGVDALGRVVRIDQAYLHVAGAELVPCEPRAELVSLRQVAYAHHGSADGAALQVGHFVALHEGRYELGVLSPAPGSYCALRVTIEPADATTEGLGESGYVEGVTIAVEGEWSILHEQGVTRAESAGNALFELPLAEPLVISADEPDAALELSFDLAGALARTDASADPYDLGLDLVALLDEHTSCGRDEDAP